MHSQSIATGQGQHPPYQVPYRFYKLAVHTLNLRFSTFKRGRVAACYVQCAPDSPRKKQIQPTYESVRQECLSSRLSGGRFDTTALFSELDHALVVINAKNREIYLLDSGKYVQKHIGHIADWAQA